MRASVLKQTIEVVSKYMYLSNKSFCNLRHYPKVSEAAAVTNCNLVASFPTLSVHNHTNMYSYTYMYQQLWWRQHMQ